MDQAASSHQGPLRHFHQFGKNPDLDRRFIHVLVAIIRKRLHLELNLYTILQILSVTLFEKVPLDQLFANYDHKNLPESKEPLRNQLNLFDY